MIASCFRTARAAHHTQVAKHSQAGDALHGAMTSSVRRMHVLIVRRAASFSFRARFGFEFENGAAKDCASAWAA
jgi:hypothetical protein